MCDLLVDTRYYRVNIRKKKKGRKKRKTFRLNKISKYKIGDR